MDRFGASTLGKTSLILAHKWSHNTSCKESKFLWCNMQWNSSWAITSMRNQNRKQKVRRLPMTSVQDRLPNWILPIFRYSSNVSLSKTLSDETVETTWFLATELIAYKLASTYFGRVKLYFIGTVSYNLLIRFSRISLKETVSTKWQHWWIALKPDTTVLLHRKHLNERTSNDDNLIAVMN